jgi:hypothetical protein
MSVLLLRWLNNIGCKYRVVAFRSRKGDVVEGEQQLCSSRTWPRVA